MDNEEQPKDTSSIIVAEEASKAKATANRSTARAKRFWKNAKKTPFPKHLSQTSTPTSDDPAWTLVLDIDGVSPLMEEVTDSRFLLEGRTYDGYCELEHIELANQDTEYRKSISASMAAYHSILALMVRQSGFLKDQGRKTEDSARLVDEISPTRVNLATPTASYLAGIGDVTDDRGVKYIPFVDSPGTHKVNFDFITNDFYMLPAPDAANISDWTSQPQPAIYLARVAADYRYTRNPTPANRTWMVPVTNSTPNDRLPGWRLARKLQHNQMEWLVSNGWTWNNNKVTIPSIELTGYSLNSELFWRVDAVIKRIKTYQITNGISTDQRGSTGELVWIQGDSNDLFTGNFRSESSQRLDTRAQLIGLERGYRWRRGGTGWMPFDGNHNEWRGHENDRFNKYESGGLTQDIFATAPLIRMQLLVEVFRKFRVSTRTP